MALISLSPLDFNAYVYNPNWEKVYKSAINDLKQGLVKNIVVSSIGTVGNVILSSKRRFYTNDAVINAFNELKTLINTEQYYRLMFDSHPSSENDIGGFGEENRSEDIAGQLLDIELEKIIKYQTEFYFIVIKFLINKPQIIEFLLSGGNPILGISHRGVIGCPSNINISSITDKIGYFDSVLYNIDKNSIVKAFEILKLIGYDIVTFPALPFAVISSKNLITYNYFETESSLYKKDYAVDSIQVNYITNNLTLDNINDHKLLFENNYKILDNIKEILSLEGDKMKEPINYEKIITDKDYAFSVFELLFSYLDKANEFFESINNGEVNVEEFVENNFEENDVFTKDDAKEILGFLVENQDKVKDFYNEYVSMLIEDTMVYASNIMKNTFDNDTLSKILSGEVNFTDDDLMNIVNEKYTKIMSNSEISDIFNIIKASLDSIKNDPDLQKKYLLEFLYEEFKNISIVDNLINSLNEVTEDSNKIHKGKQIGDDVFSKASEIKNLVNENKYDEEEFKTLINEVFGIVRCYDKQKCQKLPHHIIVEENGKYVPVLSEQGLKSATAFLLGAMGGVIATRKEKVECAKHLLKHYAEINLEPPTRLKKVAENSSIGFFDDDKNINIKINDSIIEKIINNEFEKYNIDENNAPLLINTIDNIISTFAEGNGIVEISDEIFIKMLRIIYKAVVEIVDLITNTEVEIPEENEYVENSEYEDFVSEASSLKQRIVELEALIADYQNKVNELLEENSKLKDEVLNLRDTVAKYEETYKTTDMQLELLNEIYNQKLNMIFKFKNFIDNETYNEIVKCNDKKELDILDKYLNKVYNNNLMFKLSSKKVDREYDDVTVTDSVNFRSPLSNITYNNLQQNKNKNDFINKALKLIIDNSK